MNTNSFDTTPADFDSILAKYRRQSSSERDKGNRFERLMRAFLLTVPEYTGKFRDVWLWNDFFGKNDLGGLDTGIDIVAQTVEGEYWAVQCKCYQDDTYIDKPAVNSFLATSSRTFRDKNGTTIGFAHCLWISTTNKWGLNAENAIRNQQPAVTRINLYDLQQAQVDWKKLENGVHGDDARKPKKELRAHQRAAMEKTHEHFKTSNRGKLIMACGTGKTFNALRIAESETTGKGLILFLVPSIALLGQTLREWAADAQKPFKAICICSDPEVSKKKTKTEDSDISVVDLVLPASTNVDEILRQFRHGKDCDCFDMTVIFSTYQSIEVVAKAQSELLNSPTSPASSPFGVFDLIICDEAHRTTGVKLSGEEDSAFTKVHDNDFIKAKKRLYMTATPRLYSDESKSRAAQADAVLCSMDDPDLYGEEIYRIGFGEAVEKDLLTDYKVLILTLNESDVPPSVQKMITDDTNEIEAGDASKLIGCINALSKQVLGDEGSIRESDPEPMRRAVAFCQNIEKSKAITKTYNDTSGVYIASLPEEKRSQMVSVTCRHVDGKMSAPERNDLLGWLKSEPDEGECRILTNVRCLSEGVDVPSLDAVLFLSARNSQVDVVQSVGRVMRKAPGKKYGYIIIPVIIPTDVEPDRALDDNERYRVVWTVLNALRAHDDRFNAIVNKIDLNRARPYQITVGTADTAFDEEGNPVNLVDTDKSKTTEKAARQLRIQFETLQRVVFARMVKKVGERGYWDEWAKSVAGIAERQIVRIGNLVKGGGYRQAFEKFLDGLQKNINPGVTVAEAIEMLSQHIITKPIFEALFEGYSFVKNNPVSVSMQQMLEILEQNTINRDAAQLDEFYRFVRRNIANLDNAAAKQSIIIRLYDNFFRTAFPKMVERLGIVYTPVEVVDFIIHSVEDVLNKEFGRKLTDENVNILDPFTGTGTFITRLIQSGFINPADLPRKYRHEMFANEIVLLAYYIATVNIENVYHDAVNTGIYQPFEGICLTDTFQLGETDDAGKLFSELFPQNSERVQRQKNTPITVIMSNPPYSVGQKSANDNAQNQSYPKLDALIADTYAKASNAGLNKSLYDAYIKAFRWSTDRIENNDGIIAFITNSGWLDGNSTDGFRKYLQKEFSEIYVFDLRGAVRGRSGESAKREGKNVFDIMTGVAVTILVKKNKYNGDAKVHYRDIGDYLSRTEKFEIMNKAKSINGIDFRNIIPDEQGDWLNQRNDVFPSFISLAPEKKFDAKAQSFFLANIVGVATGRDAWVLNFSKEKLADNMQRMFEFYNEQSKAFIDAKKENPSLDVENFIDTNPAKISWTVNLKKNIEKGKKHKFDENERRIVTYRPFTKHRLYYEKSAIERPGLWVQFFPTEKHKNLVICVPGAGNIKDFSTHITDCIRDYDTYGGTQCFPLYYFEENQTSQGNLFDKANEGKYIRRDAISDFILERCRSNYGQKVSKEDIFYYVYGILHSPQYRETFAADLKKMLPRLPLVDEPKDFWSFSKAGRDLASLHLNYETVEPYRGVRIIYGAGSDVNYRVEKMRFAKDGKETDKTKIIYNHQIVIENIPLEAYGYVVNGKPAIEWIMERYAVTTHKESGIVNDPNDWATETGKPRYILDLLQSVINVSVQTVDIVKRLPVLSF